MATTPNLNSFVNPNALGSGGGFLSGLANFAKSPGGSSLLQSILGGIGGGIQAGKQDKLNQQQQALQQQGLAQNQQQFNQNDALTRAQGLTSAAPTGWDQTYEQQQLAKALMLQHLINYQPPPPVNADVAAKLQAMGWKPQQFTLPTDWAGTDPFGADQTMSSVASRQGVLQNLAGGNAPDINIGAGGYDPTKSALLASQMNAYKQGIAQNYNSMANGQLNPNSGASPLSQAINGGPQPPGPTGAQKAVGIGASLAPMIASKLFGAGPALGLQVDSLIAAPALKAMVGPHGQDANTYNDQLNQKFLDEAQYLGLTPEEYAARGGINQSQQGTQYQNPSFMGAYRGYSGY